MRYMICMLTAMLLAPFGAAAQEDNSRSVNFFIFQKSNADFDFDPIVFGDFGQFVHTMKGAKLLLMSHSARAVSGNVINLQEDVLSEKQNGDFDDVGVNCQLTFSYDGEQSDLEYHITGDCQIHGIFGNEPMKLKAHIPAMDLPDTIDQIHIWLEVYEDKKSGIAFYANVSPPSRKRH